jgi:hypothetical protein
MISDNLRNSLKLADRELMLAEAELSRPHEDVVTLSACQSVRSSMKHMMRLYLLANATETNDKMSTHELMKLCVRGSKLFNTVDISNIGCKDLSKDGCDGRYCLAIENVSACVAAARQVKAIVWKELKINDGL